MQINERAYYTPMPQIVTAVSVGSIDNNLVGSMSVTITDY
jgi:hypothetical protein